MKVVFRTCGLIILGLILFFIPNSLPEATPPPSSEGCTSLGNPAAAYCQTIMGYDYQVVTAADGGQNGVCLMPGGETCDQWDFYAGKCGQAYSWCEQAGYTLETRSDGKDPYSREYSVCVDKQGKEVGSTVTLSGLSALSTDIDLEVPKVGIEHSTVEPLPVGVSNPSSFDWRNYNGINWMTSVKNQGSCGGCWSFSTVGLTEAQHNIIPADPTIDLNLAEQYLISDCCPYGNCGGGVDVYALEYIRDFGVPDEACYPYIAVDSACSARCSNWNSRLEYVPNAHYNYTDYTTTDMKYYLSHYGPITITLGIDTPVGGYWDGDIYRCVDDSIINHSVLAVGYDDVGGYWIAKNSWGTSWGDDGYFKIGYGECKVEDSQISWVQSSLPGLYKTFLPMIVKGGPASQVLWSQPISGVNTDVIANQDFETAYNAYDIYIADDFIVPAGGWNIKEIFVPGDLWNIGTPSLANANHLVFQIYTNSTGAPNGYPGGGSPLWSLSLVPTSGQITLSTGLGGYLSNAKLTLTSPLNLGPGTYWLVFYPEMSYTIGGQYGRYVSDTTNGFAAKVINPGGAFSIPTGWTSIQDASTWGMTQQDMAFEIRGNP